MEVTGSYSLAYLGIWLILATLVVQSLVAATVKARQPGAIPGKMPEHLSHDSLVFRAQRTFMNSLENSPVMVMTGFLAAGVGANPLWTGVLLMVYALARIVHMALYYGIATERNPSPRSYFYLLGVISNLLLFGVVAVAFI